MDVIGRDFWHQKLLEGMKSLEQMSNTMEHMSNSLSESMEHMSSSLSESISSSPVMHDFVSAAAGSTLKPKNPFGHYIPRY